MWLRLKNEARIAFDDKERRHKRHLRALIERLHQHEAARVMGVDDERLRLMAEERCCHDAATQMAMSVARSCADVYQRGSCTSCRVGSMPAHRGSDMRQPSLPLCPLCGPSPPCEITTISGSADDNLARTTGHVVFLPPPYIIRFGRSPQYQRGWAFVATFDVAYRGGSNITFRRQRGVG